MVVAKGVTNALLHFSVLCMRKGKRAFDVLEKLDPSLCDSVSARPEIDLDSNILNSTHKL